VKHAPAPKPAAKRAPAAKKNFWRLPNAHHGHRKPARWYHGVFVYGPAPQHHHNHNTVVVKSGRKASSPTPTRDVNRAGSFSVGGQGGVYAGAYDGGAGYADFGVGFTANYRPVEALGIELAYTYFNQTFDEGSERETGVFAPSVQLYAVPWNTISPYASLGVTWAGRSYDDAYNDGYQQKTAYVQESAFGPHLGLGMEFALGQRAALDLEARYTSFLNVGGDDPSAPGALTGTAGLNFYF